MEQISRFKELLELVINVSKDCSTSIIDIIFKYILDDIHEQNIERNLTLINNKEEIIGSSFLGNSATMNRTPLLKFWFKGEIPDTILELVDLQGNFADGG